MACFILFLILPYFFTQSAVATNSTFYLNSSLPSTWYNNNSINTTFNGADGSRVRAVLSRTKGVGFVCGFYCTGSCSSYLFSVVVVGGGGSNPGVVWSANRDRPVGENATLQLTRDGDLVLRDSDGTNNYWSTNTSGKSVVGMNMTEAGNLVLFNGTGAIVWQSFDSPTDTLLFGQRLYEGQRLISSSSATNWSPGLYYATLTSITGFAAYTQVGEDKPQMYYQLVPEQISTDQNSLTGHCRLLIREEENTSRTSDGSNYAELLKGGFLVNWGTSQESFGSNPFELPVKPFIEYIKLESDGHLKIYRHNNASGPREVINMVSRDLGECQHPRRCGEYGLCSREGNCSCPIDAGSGGDRYFKQTEVSFPDGGCSRITPLSCPSSPNQQHLVEVKNASYFNIIDSDSAFTNITDMEGCKQACQQNCSCRAAFFRYDNNISDGYCYMPSEILSIRDGQIPNHNFTSATFVKVQIPPPPPPRKDGKNLTAILAGSGSGVLFIFILIVILCLWVKLGKTDSEDEEDYDYIRQVPGMPVMFLYDDLRIATEDFKDRLGGGGFGSVFKGMLLRDGTEVAVKRLDKMGQGMREFIAEVETIGSLHHFNLVRLIGFCAEKSRRLLVYEYLSNGSLDNWIFYRDQKPCLDWQTRKNIILDIARGLAYLHEECRQRIIHLDIKPQNILLDENFNAKISDFGLSKLVDRDESQVLTTLRGTPGYIAPECGQSRITVKVDIYSFGIVLLEIVSGRRNLDRTRSESSKHLLSMLQKKADEDRLFDIVENLDEEVQGRREEVVRLINIGAWCLQNDPTRRPLMSTVVKVLEGVMEVDPDINYNFTHAMASSTVANDNHVSTTAPQASVLSNPR